MAATKEVTITAPNLQTLELDIVGTAPLVLHRFWKKAELMGSMAQGKSGKKGGKKPPRNFESDYEQSMHKSTEGWLGFPASSIRNGCISACRLINFKMTLAKLSIWVEADGYDGDGYPLVRLTEGTPHRHDAAVRNATGVVDVRSRPMFKAWAARLRITFDADQFTATDVVNLVSRVGAQVGIGEGRPDSKASAGMGWGTFRVKTAEEQRNVA